jgi:hypothetical protein
LSVYLWSIRLLEAIGARYHLTFAYVASFDTCTEYGGAPALATVHVLRGGGVPCLASPIVDQLEDMVQRSTFPVCRPPRSRLPPHTLGDSFAMSEMFTMVEPTITFLPIQSELRKRAKSYKLGTFEEPDSESGIPIKHVGSHLPWDGPSCGFRMHHH